MSYMTLSSQEKNPFLLCSYFRVHPATLLLQILGRRMHGPSPHLKFFWGAVPPVPLGLRPCYRPPNLSAYSSKPSAFLDEFGSIFSLSSAIPNVLVLVGDFKFHVGILTLLSLTSLTSYHRSSGLPSKSAARGGDVICRPPKKIYTTPDISDIFGRLGLP